MQRRIAHRARLVIAVQSCSGKSHGEAKNCSGKLQREFHTDVESLEDALGEFELEIVAIDADRRRLVQAKIVPFFVGILTPSTQA